MVASLLAGASLVAVLVVRQRAEGAAALIGATTLGIAMYYTIEVGSRYDRLDATFYALGFFFLGIGGGWSGSSAALELLARREVLPRIADRLPEPLPRTHVIVVTCFEPERYEPAATAAMLKTLSDEELLEPTITTLPFMFFAQKARYRAIGSVSPARSQMTAICERLRVALGATPDSSVSWANCSGPERLSVKVADAVNRGYRNIVVCELAVGESLHLAAAKREVDMLGIDRFEVRIAYTDPLADSEPLAALLSRRLLAAAKPDPSTGIILIGHGQPEERARLNPAFDEQENAFLNRIRMLLADEGMDQEYIRVAWSEWRAPDVSSTVRHLAALGCQRIILAPAVYPLDGLPTRLDIDIAVRQARLDSGVSCVTMSAWQDDEQVIAELVRRINAA